MWYREFLTKNRFFKYFDLIFGLLEGGEYKIITTNTASGASIVSTLYIDGDILLVCDSEQLPDDTLIAQHLGQLNNKVGSINSLIRHCQLAAFFLAFGMPQFLHFGQSIGNGVPLSISGVSSIVAIIFRRKLGKIVLRMLGHLIRFMIKHKFLNNLK